MCLSGISAQDVMTVGDMFVCISCCGFHDSWQCVYVLYHLLGRHMTDRTCNSLHVTLDYSYKLNLATKMSSTLYFSAVVSILYLDISLVSKNVVGLYDVSSLAVIA